MYVRYRTRQNVCPEAHLFKCPNGQTGRFDPPRIAHTAMTMQRHERKLRMQHSHDTPKPNLLESLKAFLTAQSLQTHQERLCSECGAVMQYSCASFGVSGKGSPWILR